MSLPLKLLHEAKGMEVSLEVTNGEVYNGILTDVQETMNVVLTQACKTGKAGHTTRYASVLIRGSNIVFFQLSEKLKESPTILTAGKLVPLKEDARGQGNGFGGRARAKPKKPE